MKRTLFTIIMMFAALIYADQVRAQNGLEFGVRGGLNFATLNDTEEDVDVDNLTGLMAGIYARFPIPNTPVSIQPEILYTQKGAESSDIFEGQESTLKLRLDYIEVPVLARFDFINDGSLTPHVYFGPYLSFNVSADAEVTDGESSFSGDISDEVKDMNVGIVTGAGLDYNRFNFGVRYGVGLVDTFENGDGKNGVFSVTVGFGF